MSSASSRNPPKRHARTPLARIAVGIFALQGGEDVNERSIKSCTTVVSIPPSSVSMSQFDPVQEALFDRRFSIALALPMEAESE